MRNSLGFTIVEMVIAISVMTILVTLTTVGMLATQANGRDSERRADVEAIAKHLDTLYSRGITVGPTSIKGSYPPTAWIGSDSGSTRAAILREIPAGSLVAPQETTSVDSLFAATNALTGTDPTASASSVAPAPSADRPYIYQPIDNTGALCTATPPPPTQTCRKFNIYAWQETTPNAVIKIESRFR